MSSEKTMSLYQYIAEAAVDGCLPKDFSLPKNPEDGGIMWADGARDGVAVYHTMGQGLSEEDRVLMESAVQAASRSDDAEADGLFGELGRKARAISLIDELQAYVIDNKDALSVGNIFQYAARTIVDSSDVETVKIGLSLLELFDTDRVGHLNDVIWTLGLSDELSLFAIFVMRQWQDGNTEIYELAKRLHGWGRIHAVEQIEAETEEIRQWLLTEGVHNDILPAYSALVCWQKSDAESILKGNPSREEFSGIRDMIEGLLDEGPVQGISAIEDGVAMIMTFLKQAKKIEPDLSDYEVIRQIRIRYGEGDSENSAVVRLCQELLTSEACKGLVREAVKEGRALSLAQDLQLEYKAEVLQLLKAAFDEHFYLCSYLMNDSDYRAETLELFRRKLPLEEMKALPTDSMGLGEEYRKHHQLECIVQELFHYPLEGIAFVETALQCAPIRTRHMGARALQNWVSVKETPLERLLPDTCRLVCRLRDIEVDEKVRERLESLAAGKV